jgi:hypothetical protein
LTLLFDISAQGNEVEIETTSGSKPETKTGIPVSKFSPSPHVPKRVPPQHFTVPADVSAHAVSPYIAICFAIEPLDFFAAATSASKVSIENNVTISTRIVMTDLFDKFVMKTP